MFPHREYFPPLTLHIITQSKRQPVQEKNRLPHRIRFPWVAEALEPEGAI